MSFAPIRLDGGGCCQMIAQSPDGKTLVGGADTQGFYMSQTVPLATTWTVQQKGIGQSALWRQCPTLLWSSSETGTIYAGVGDSGNLHAGGLLAGVLSGTYPNQRITWSMRAPLPQWAGNGGGGTGGQTRPSGNLLAQDASYLYAGTYSQGIMRSSNTGGAGSDNFPVTFKMGGSAPGNGNWFCAALNMHPGTGNLYAGMYNPSGTAAGLYQCTAPQAGAPNFTAVAGGPTTVMDIIPLGNYIYCAAGNQGLWRYGPVTGSPAWQNLNGSTIPTPAGTTSNWWSTVAGYVDGSSNHVVGIVDGSPPQNGVGGAYFCTIPSNYPTGSITYVTNNVCYTAKEPPGYTWWHAGGSYHNWFCGNGFFAPSLIVDASNLSAVNWYCAGSEGCARSLSGTTNWTIANSGMPQFLAHPIAVDPVVGKHIAFGDSDWGHWDDTAPGTENASTLLNASPVGSAQGYAIAFDPVDSTVYAGSTGSGQKYSNNGGTIWSRPGNSTTWTKTSWSNGGNNAIGLCALRQPDGGAQKILLVAAWGSGLWYGKLTGSTWSFVNKNGTACPSQAGNFACFTYYGGGLVYCYDRVTGLYRSPDYGQTWTKIWTQNGAGDIACNPAVQGELWLVQAGNLWHLTGANAGTVGGGITAVQIGNIPGSGDTREGVAVDGNGNVLITTTDRGNGSGLWRSADKGATWSNLDTDGSFAASCLNPEHIAVGPDGTLYFACGNVVVAGLAGGSPPPPLTSLPFTERQDSGNTLGSGGVIGLWFSETSGGPAGGLGAASQAGSLLVARIETNDGTATITPPDSNWVLDADEASGTGSGVARTQIWHYPNNPGGLGGPGSVPAVLQTPPPPGGRHPLTPGAAILPAGGAAGLSGTGSTGRAAMLGLSQVAADGELLTFTSSNSAATLKGKLQEYTTPAGSQQFVDQTGVAAAAASATSLPVSASAPNAYTGGLGVVVFSAAWSPAPSGQTWTAPSGWTTDGVGNNAPTAFSQYYQAGLAAGTTSVTGTIVPGSGGTMTAWSAALATFYAVAATPVQITTASCPNGTTSVAYGPGGAGKTLAATGGVAPYTWTLASGTLPAGLSLSAGGVISGTPSAGGTYTFTVQAADSANQSASATYTVTIATGLTVATTSPLPGGQAGVAYTAVQLAAAGGTSPYTWSITAGALPPGLTLPAGGLISGTPSLAGTYTVTVTVTDHAGVTAAASLSVTIAAASATLAITPVTLPEGTLGQPYGPVTFHATGGVPPYTWALASGTLPPGLTLTSNADSTATITGTLAAPAADYPFTLTVTDSA